MNTPHEQIADWRDVDAATFRDSIAARGQPAVLRGLVRQWPIVQQGASSPRAMCAYLLGLRQGDPVPLLTAEPAVKGRFFFGMTCGESTSNASRYPCRARSDCC